MKDFETLGLLSSYAHTVVLELGKNYTICPSVPPSNFHELDSYDRKKLRDQWEEFYQNVEKSQQNGTAYTYMLTGINYTYNLNNGCLSVVFFNRMFVYRDCDVIKLANELHKHGFKRDVQLTVPFSNGEGLLFGKGLITI